MAFESPGAFNAASSYSAEQSRRAWFSWLARTSAGTPGIVAGGLLGAADLQLSAPGSGMSVNVSTGECIVGGTEGANQGGYYGRGSSQTNLVIAAANPSNPRVDTICATVSDSGYTEPTGGSGNQLVAQVVTGTPTSGATLANLSGVAALPASSLLLGYVLVPTSATNIITADIANVATVATPGLGIGGAGARGAVNIATSQSVTSTTYTTLATPDQVTGIVLPTNGLIAVWYQATWQESVATAAAAAIFLGASQLQAVNASGSPVAPAPISAVTSDASDAGLNRVLATFAGGLADFGRNSGAGNAYSGDVTTGQIVGSVGSSSTSSLSTSWGTIAGPFAVGGPCYIFATAGTYTVSVQFKSSSGSVTVSNRKLWVQALPFS